MASQWPTTCSPATPPTSTPSARRWRTCAAAFPSGAWSSWPTEGWVDRRRYVVCHNGEAEERDRKRREEIVQRAREDLKKKGVQAFAVPRGLKRFVELVGGELSLKEAAIREEARYDGKWVLRTNTTLPTAEVALAYKELWQVERAWRGVER